MHDRLGLSKARIAVLIVLSLLVGGVAGLASVLLCRFVVRFGGVDSAEKHGISTANSIRVGGLLVCMYLVLNIGYQYFILESSLISSTVVHALWGSLLFFALGFYEDLTGELGAVVRFVLMLGISLGLVHYDDQFRILPIGVAILDQWLFSTQSLALLISGVSLAFLANAFNTADGANGLASGIALFCALGLVLVAPADMQLLMRSVAVSCILFLLYNLISGRFFLGDGGAYMLGITVGLAVIVASNKSLGSVWFLLTLIFYPVADLLWSMTRRIASGRSPLSADDGHLHNHLFHWLVAQGLKVRSANTLTGLTVACLFSGLPLLLFFLTRIRLLELNWLWVYVTMWFTYACAWVVLASWRHNKSKDLAV